MSTIQILMLATILVYLIGMVAIGAVLAKENRTTDDFYLGGRKLGPFVTAMSAEASDMSSWLLMGLPGVAYLTGTADAGMDSHWSCHRNLCKLAPDCKTSS